MDRLSQIGTSERIEVKTDHLGTGHDRNIDYARDPLWIEF